MRESCGNCRHYADALCACEKSPYWCGKNDYAPSKFHWCEWYDKAEDHTIELFKRVYEAKEVE